MLKKTEITGSDSKKCAVYLQTKNKQHIFTIKQKQNNICIYVYIAVLLNALKKNLHTNVPRNLQQTTEMQQAYLHLP